MFTFANFPTTVCFQKLRQLEPKGRQNKQQSLSFCMVLSAKNNSMKIVSFCRLLLWGALIVCSNTEYLIRSTEYRIMRYIPQALNYVLLGTNYYIASIMLPLIVFVIRLCNTFITIYMHHENDKFYQFHIHLKCNVHTLYKRINHSIKHADGLSE